MTPGPVWIGADNLAATGIRSPALPSRTQSLYRLSYLIHYLHDVIIIIIIIIIFVNCCWVVTRWQWLFYMYTKYEIGY